MRGSTYHHTGKPTNTVSYCAMSCTGSAIAGRLAGSFISTVLRLFLSIQFKSADVYGSAGRISYRSAPMDSAISFATRAVTPLAEK